MEATACIEIESDGMGFGHEDGGRVANGRNDTDSDSDPDPDRKMKPEKRQPDAGSNDKERSQPHVPDRMPLAPPLTTTRRRRLTPQSRYRFVTAKPKCNRPVWSVTGKKQARKAAVTAQ
jgi:hypothetical protein